MGRRRDQSAIRRRRYRTGHWAEAVTALMLRLKGYRVLARRFRCPVGEIDIIARRGRHVAFVEVKFRRHLSDNWEVLAPRQKHRLIRAAEWWLARQEGPEPSNISFDLVLVTPWRWPRHLPHAFTV